MIVEVFATIPPLCFVGLRTVFFSLCRLSAFDSRAKQCHRQPCVQKQTRGRIREENNNNFLIAEHVYMSINFLPKSH